LTVSDYIKASAAFQPSPRSTTRSPMSWASSTSSSFTTWWPMSFPPNRACPWI